MSDPIAIYYDELADRYGDDPRAVDATDQQALDVRYRVLGDLTDMNGKTVLEVGCGYGGLGAYLSARYPDMQYKGIDVSEGLIRIGHKHWPDLDLRQLDFFDLDFQLRRYDVILGQGIFYLLASDQHPGHLIRRMWHMASEAVAFTAISTWKPDLDPAELHIDPFQTLKFCRGLTPWVALRHDYRLGDVAVYMFRKDSNGSDG